MYIVEEIKSEVASEKEAVARKDKAKSALEQAISDFQFVLGRAIEGVSSTGNARPRLEDDNAVPQRDIENIRQTFKKLKEISEKERLHRQTTPTNFQIKSPAQFKSYSIRMIKALKEDLAKIQNEYIVRVNANIDAYLTARDSFKLMSEQQLREEINQLSQQVL